MGFRSSSGDHGPARVSGSDSAARRRRGWVYALAAWTLAGCGGGSGPGTEGDAVQRFCAAAAAAPACDPAATCEDRFQQGIVMSSKCEARYYDFAACLAELSLACVDGPDFEIHASGDGSPAPSYLSVMPIYAFYVDDGACYQVGLDLRSCTVCSGAVGYPGGRGVGDRCSDSQPCADGLGCQFGMCTKPCTGDGDCQGTNAGPDSCPNEFSLQNYCNNEGMCAGAAHVDNDFCAAYGPGWEGSGENTGFGLWCYHP
jgi:hypothetical protein